MAHNSPVPGSNGDRYIPFDQRTGDKSVVYFTRDLSAQGLVSIFRRVSGVLTGKVAVKVHTGEQHGPNIIPRSWVKALMEQELPGGTIVETNTYYDGDRYTTEKHRKTLQVNGWTFCPGDPNMWSIAQEELMERMTESTKSVFDRFGRHICYINVLRNMSVSCDCEGTAAMPVVTPNIGIVASLDILAADQASVDLIYALKPEDGHDLVQRMETRHGLRQLSYMKELGMGHDRYTLVDIDHDDAPILPAQAVQDVTPFAPDGQE